VASGFRRVNQASTVKAPIRFGIGGDHQVFGDGALLGQEGMAKSPTSAPVGELSGRGSILGSETGLCSLAQQIVESLAGALPVQAHAVHQGKLVRSAVRLGLARLRSALRLRRAAGTGL
jgi:hypothetical protein